MNVVEQTSRADELRVLRQDLAAVKQALTFAMNERDFWREQVEREKNHAAELLRRLTETIREFAL